MSQTIWTIGYEGTTQPELIKRLKAAGVEIVADVRAVTSSRRAGFSKNVLAASLSEAGIGYVHFRGLGTPKAGRDAARKGRVAEMRAIFAEQMEGPDAVRDLAALRVLAAERRVALLCYEADAAGCHRRAVFEMLGAAATDL